MRSSPKHRGDSIAIEEGMAPAAAPRRRDILGLPSVVVAGVCYCVASGSMVLLNKKALSAYEFKAPNALLCFQCTLAVALVKACEALRLIRPLQPLRRELVAVWFPVNLIFVGMIGSSFYALATVGVGMVTIWKNVSNVVTAVCDVTIYGKRYNMKVWGCLFLMLLSAVTGAFTDIRFSWSGYGWQIVNCAFTSAYALYLRSVMDKIAEHTSNRQRLDESSMVFYNNLLSIPPILLLMWLFGEYNTVWEQPALWDPGFQATAALGGIIGFGISYSALWFLSETTATYYSLVGALNKIPVAIVGILVFMEPTNFNNLLSIVIGLSAGILFVFAKQSGPAK